MAAMPAIFLLDNGSLQAASTLSLRRLARALSARTGQNAEPVSLLHSDAVDPAELGGVPAEILEPAVRRRWETGEREFILTPLFFGPSRALTDYLPARAAALRSRHPGLVLRLAPCVVPPAGEERMTDILADHARRARRRNETDERPAVVLVDHGSPEAPVAAVRDALAAALAARLGAEVRGVQAASMERRPGPEFAFNEPLLETALARPGFDRGAVTVCPLFFSPGRHAGPGGDIARLCRAAERRQPGLRTALAPLVGEHPRLIEILADRLNEGKSAPAL